MTDAALQLSAEALTAGLEKIRRSPKDGGVVKMIVRRPATDERAVLSVGELDVDEGLVGDNWRRHGSSRASV